MEKEEGEAEKEEEEKKKGTDQKKLKKEAEVGGGSGVFASDEVEEAERLKRMMAGEEEEKETEEFKVEKHSAEEISEKIKKAKLRAVEFKRAGKQQQAMEALKLAKVLEGEKKKVLEEEEEKKKQKEIEEEKRKKKQKEAEAPVPAPRPPAPVPAPRMPAQTPPAATEDSGAGQSLAQKQLALMKTRQGEYRRMAIACKKSNDMAEAKKMLIMVKMMGPHLEQLEMGISIDPKEIPPPPEAKQPSDSESSQPQAPPRINVPSQGSNNVLSQAAARVAAATDADSARSSLATYDAKFQKLIAKCTDQVNLCLKQAKQFMTDGDKTTALKYFKLKKTFEQTLESLQSSYDSEGPLPRYHYEEHSIEIVKHFPLIAEEDMEIVVSEARGVKPPPKYSESDLDLYVCGVFGYPTNAPVSFQTDNVRKTCDPKFNFKTVCPFERKKPFQRLIKKSTAMTFELFQKGGFLRKSILLGTAKMDLEDLETKCEIVKDLDFVDSKRKAAGSRLGVQIRIREPLLSRDVQEAKHSFLTIDDFNPPASADASLRASVEASARSSIEGSPMAKPNSVRDSPMTVIREQELVPHKDTEPTSASPVAASQQSVSAPPVPAPRTPVPAQPASKSAPSTPAPEAKGAKQALAAPAASSGRTSPSVSPRGGKSPGTPASPATSVGGADDLEEPSIDDVVSNMVLEWEQEQVDKLIIQYKTQKKGVPEDVTDRKNQIDIKMTILIASVQSGTLTMEGYLDMLRKRIPMDKKMALEYKSAGKTEWAKIALKRAKIMEDELHEAEAAM
eukprot:Nk52_evm21s255 gene=Nk52_evmTU21s255